MQDIKTTFQQIGAMVDYTPSGAVTGGTPVQLDGRAGIALLDIAANKQGALAVEGIMQGLNAAVTGNVGTNLYWDADGDPVSGTAGTGAYTTSAIAGDFRVGVLTAVLAAADTSCQFAVNKINPEQPAWQPLTHELKDDNYTLDAEDVGKVIHIATDAKAITLPATAAGLKFILQNDGADGAVLLTVDPNAADKIMGADLAGVDDKDRLNTKVTAVQGDYIVLLGDGASGWYVLEERGIWAAE